MAADGFQVLLVAIVGQLALKFSFSNIIEAQVPNCLESKT